MRSVKKVLWKKTLAFCLSVAMLLTLFAVPAAADEEQTCKVTVTNGAASADVQGVMYNSLHVYDKNDPELEDFLGEKEFPLGSEISYYAWPNASDIRLTVVHNGTTVEDRVIAQGDGQDIATITLEGDLTITTEAVAPSENASVTIENQVGGDPSVSVDGNIVANGDSIEKGTHTFLIQGDYITDELMEAYVTLYVNGAQVGEQTEIGYDDAEFADVEVSGDVMIRIAPYEAPEQYAVQYENKVAEENVSFNVMTVDYSSGSPAPKAIENGEFLKEGSYVGVQVLNPLDKKLLLIQYDANGNETDRAVIDAASEDEEGAGGLIIPELNSDVKFVLDYAPAAVHTLTVKQYVEGTPEIYLDNTAVADGATLEEGTHSFIVYSDYITDELSDAYVTLVIGGETVGEPVQIGMSGAEFENVEVTGDVLLKIGTQKYTVSYENKVTEDTVTYNVMTVDYSGSAPAPKAIENGESLEEGSYVGVQVLNPLDKKLLLIQYDADGNETDRAIIDAASEDEEGAGGLIIPELDSDVKFVLDYAPAMYKVTVTNGAEAANIPDVVVNAIHVYRSVGDDTDILGEAEVEEGTQISIFAYPLASDIHLKIVHNGETIADKDIAQMEAFIDDDKIEWFEFDLAGDLEVTTTPYFTILSENKVQDENVTFTVGSVDITEEGAVPVILESGDKLLGGAYLAARVINDGEKLLSLKALNALDGSVMDEVQIMPGDAQGIMYPENNHYVKFVAEEAVGKLDAAAFDSTPLVYTGKAQTLTDSLVVTAKINDKDVRLTPGRDYEVSYSNNANAGQAVMTITGIGSFEGSSLTKTFTIDRASLAKAAVTVSDQTYDGKAKTPDPVVKLGNVTLKKGTDYSVKYSNNTNAGTAAVTITGSGNYSGSVTKNFTINRASLAKAAVTAKKQTYNGKAKTPAPVVRLGTVTLKKGTDYTVKYSKNVKAGTAVVTVTGTGNYKGSAKGSFVIKKAANPMTVKTTVKSKKAAQIKKNAKVVAPIRVNKAQGKVTYVKTAGSKKLTINKTTGKVTIAKGTRAGTYTAKIRITASGNSNYKKLVKTVKIKITVK